MRYVCQFSCGVTSAVATKMTLAKYGDTHDVQIINAFLVQEHPDNRRFLADCEKWFGRKITVLRDTKYGASTVNLFRKKQFMKSQFGAPCSRELKRTLLDAWKIPDDVMVFGYDKNEEGRRDDFLERYPDKPAIFPLIDANLSKADCLALVERAGIELPMMYKLGYNNANCIGCVKGGEGYWNKIRIDFPEQFEELAQVQEEIGPGAYLFRNRKTGERYSLRDLPPNKGRNKTVLPSCSFYCENAEGEMGGT